MSSLVTAMMRLPCSRAAMNGSLVTEHSPKATVVPPRTSPPPRDEGCCRAHLNSLWSVWYGLAVTGLQGYIAFNAGLRFLGEYNSSITNNSYSRFRQTRTLLLGVLARATACFYSRVPGFDYRWDLQVFGPPL